MSDPYQLESVPIFRNIPPEQLAPVRAVAVRQVYKGGAAIFHQGDIPRFLYVVESGVVDIVLPAVSDDVTLASFESGSFFGELAVFDHQPRTATARAVGDTSLICIPLDAIAELVDGHPAAAKQFMSVIIERLRSAEEKARLAGRGVWLDTAHGRLNYGIRRSCKCDDAAVMIRVRFPAEQQDTGSLRNRVRNGAHNRLIPALGKIRNTLNHCVRS